MIKHSVITVKLPLNHSNRFETDNSLTDGTQTLSYIASMSIKSLLCQSRTDVAVDLATGTDTETQHKQAT